MLQHGFLLGKRGYIKEHLFMAIPIMLYELLFGSIEDTYLYKEDTYLYKKGLVYKKG